MTGNNSENHGDNTVVKGNERAKTDAGACDTMPENKGKTRRRRTAAAYLLAYDILAVNAAFLLGLLLRFDLKYSAIPIEYLHAFYKFAPFYTVACIAVFHLMHLYNSLWRFASFDELNRILTATGITALVQTIGITLFVARMPISYYILGTIIQFGLVTAVRFSYRYVRLLEAHRRQSGKELHPTVVVGAGAAGQAVIRELKNARQSDAWPVCVIDDDPAKWGKTLEGVPVVGGRKHILEAVEKYSAEQILLAIPTATAIQRRDILDICKETGCELRTLPGIYQLTNGEVSVDRIRPVAVEDLLGREPVKVNMDEIFGHIGGKTILVTGGGGSIGSELCRQVAEHDPKQLIIFDIYENNAYDIQQELRRRHGDSLDLVVLIGSVRDSRRLEQVFESYKPDIVFHAAAHKHVPLMEDSPNEAIKNNVIGTYKTAYAALKHGVSKFVLISTDKAVNPTNIMGASKRLCEMVVQSMDAISREGRTELLPFLHAHADADFGNCGIRGGNQAAGDPVEQLAVGNTDGVKTGCVKEKGRESTQFVAVRFGNVLGSNGSVIPLFKKQIEEGGPVTVTHPDIIRYFMTIPEAVSLILQASVYAWGGEIFVLDMGESVKIDTLARNLIRLSGYQPDVDIKIEYTGLRPGEKLYEEKLMEEEGLKKTDNELIHIGKPVQFDVGDFLKQLETLARAAYDNSDDIVKMVENMVPTFHPVGRHPDGLNVDGEMKNIE